MKILSTIKLILISCAWGLLVGGLVLFFMPNSKLSFNWQVAQDMFDFYKQQKASKNAELKTDKLTIENFSLAQAVEKTSPSVVSINAFRGRVRTDARLPSSQRVVDTFVSVGSGVIMTEQGHIVTNYHVIKDASQISANFSNGRKKVIEIVGYDAKTDLAVLKAERTFLPPANFGNSNNLKSGDLVMAIGSPFGGNQSVSLGIVSAIIDQPPFPPKIQTDASINQGNSGGALIDTKGNVVGINQIQLSSKGGGQTGINYAIPIDRVKIIVNEIIKYGRYRRNWLGIESVELIESDHKQYYPELPFGEGFFVKTIESGSPAEIAGLQIRDYIIKVNGKPSGGVAGFYQTFYALDLNAELEVEFYRNGKLQKAVIKLAEKK